MLVASDEYLVSFYQPMKSSIQYDEIDYAYNKLVTEHP